jgi:hypothetical protein
VVLSRVAKDGRKVKTNGPRYALRMTMAIAAEFDEFVLEKLRSFSWPAWEKGHGVFFIQHLLRRHGDFVGRGLSDNVLKMLI